jgi:predicted glycoside hydrolase/deacetylase ChbG (UPF0249 family)
MAQIVRVTRVNAFGSALITTAGDIAITRAKSTGIGDREEKGSVEGRPMLTNEMMAGESVYLHQELTTTGMMGP